MAQNAEEMCNEFARNFQALEMKYSALMQQHESDTQLLQAKHRELESRERQIAESKDTNQRLLKDLEEAAQYKDRYMATSIAMEHLKGRLESARKGLSDRDSEHQNEVEQLRGQINDLLKRVEVSSDAPLLHALRSQKGELEERCALTTGQLLEERERSNQQALTANAALRDAQARTVELEQRCRALDNEVTTMRQSVRQSQQSSNDASLERNRMSLENDRLRDTVKSLETTVADLQLKIEEQESAFSAQKLTYQRQCDHEKELLSTQVRDINTRLEEAMRQRQQDADKIISVQKTMYSKVQAAKEDMRGEVERLQHDLELKCDELTETKGRYKAVESKLEDARQTLNQTEHRLSTTERSRHALQLQLEEALQASAWSSAEKDRLNAQVQRLQNQLEEASAQANVLNSTQLEVERLKLQLHYSQAETDETRKQLESESRKTRSVQQAYETKLALVTKELKEAKREYRQNLQRLEKHKRQLVTAVIEKEHEIAAMHAMPSRGSAATVMADGSVEFKKTSPFDPLAMLRAQTEAAQQTQAELKNLSDATSASRRSAAAHSSS